jgi:hypothetical protein
MALLAFIIIAFCRACRGFRPTHNLPASILQRTSHATDLSRRRNVKIVSSGWNRFHVLRSPSRHITLPARCGIGDFSFNRFKGPPIALMTLNLSFFIWGYSVALIPLFKAPQAIWGGLLLLADLGTLESMWWQPRMQIDSNRYRKVSFSAGVLSTCHGQISGPWNSRRL